MFILGNVALAEFRVINIAVNMFLEDSHEFHEPHKKLEAVNMKGTFIHKSILEQLLLALPIIIYN